MVACSDSLRTSPVHELADECRASFQSIGKAYATSRERGCQEIRFMLQTSINKDKTFLLRSIEL